MPKKRFNWSKFWDIIAWLAFAYFMIYAFLKAINVIHSTDWITALMVGVFLGRYAMKMEFLSDNIKALSKDLKELNSHIIQNIDKHIEKLKVNCPVLKK